MTCSSIESVVRTYYTTVDTAGPDEVVALFSRDAVYRRPGYSPFNGGDELLAFYRDARVIADGRHTVERIVESGDSLAVEGTFVGVLDSGEEVSVRFADFFRVRDGLITERETYFDAPLV